MDYHMLPHPKMIFKFMYLFKSSRHLTHGLPHKIESRVLHWRSQQGRPEGLPWEQGPRGKNVNGGELKEGEKEAETNFNNTFSLTQYT